ncbi:MAG: pseudouridylate synthase [Gammaproteobacteria bacterium]|nr:pseudouridylate synthase [Gammaproteobacteria bacterium]
MEAATLSERAIIYRDDALVVLNKPCNWLVHRSAIDRHETRFIVQALKALIQQPVFPVHRLDKPTSGVLVFALNPQALKMLSLQFEAQTVVKHYHAIVRGFPAAQTIDHPLKEKAVFKNQNKDALKTQAACTHLSPITNFLVPQPVDRYPNARYSLVELKPDSGRRHQIRRHMKHIAHPIIGDTSYGKTTHNDFFRNQLNCHRLCLHAHSIRLTHPALHCEMTFEAPYDEELTQTLEQLALLSQIED